MVLRNDFIDGNRYGREEVQFEVFKVSKGSEVFKVSKVFKGSQVSKVPKASILLTLSYKSRWVTIFQMVDKMKIYLH